MSKVPVTSHGRRRSHCQRRSPRRWADSPRAFAPPGGTADARRAPGGGAGEDRGAPSELVLLMRQRRRAETCVQPGPPHANPSAYADRGCAVAPPDDAVATALGRPRSGRCLAYLAKPYDDRSRSVGWSADCFVVPLACGGAFLV
jgi:hypothetical protein